MKKIIFILAFLCPIFLSHLSAQTKDGLPLKLRVGQYNVGHFNQGKTGGYQGTDVREEMERWRTWIGQQSLDFFIVNEWNGRFDKDSTMNATPVLLEPFYKYIYFGKPHRVIYNGIASNYKLKNIRQLNLTHEWYYAVLADLVIGKKTITIMSVHLPWQECCHQSSIDMLIEEMKKYEYLICCGDMNALKTTQRRFIDEGFNMANGGYEGWFCTYPKTCAKGHIEKGHIDNIITSKNIKIMHVRVPDSGLTPNDHSPIVADLVITWE